MCCRPNFLRIISIISENKGNKQPDFEIFVPDEEDDAAECTICLEKFSGDATKINIGTLVSCGHYYHFECLWEWLRMHLSCPICRNKVRWSDRHIRAVIYARFLEDMSLQTRISLVSRGEEDAHSMAAVDRLAQSGFFRHFTNRVMPAVHQTQTEQQVQRQNGLQSTLPVQDALSTLTLSESNSN